MTIMMTTMMPTMMTKMMTTMMTLRKVLVRLVIPGRSAKDKGNGDPAKNSNDNDFVIGDIDGIGNVVDIDDIEH